MSIIKKSVNSKCWTGYRGDERCSCVCYWWECELVQPLWETVWRFHKKLKIELPYDSTAPLLGIYPEKTKTLIQKDTCTHMFIEALFTIARTCKQPRYPSTDEWIKKLCYIYTYNGILLSHKKEQIRVI